MTQLQCTETKSLNGCIKYYIQSIKEFIKKYITDVIIGVWTQSVWLKSVDSDNDINFNIHYI